jgi:hypothetical protein
MRIVGSKTIAAMVSSCQLSGVSRQPIAGVEIVLPKNLPLTECEAGAIPPDS